MDRLAAISVRGLRGGLLALVLLVPTPAGADGLTAVVAARTIHAGETVEPAALAVLAVRSRPAPGFVARVDDAAGRIARRTLVRGRLIPRDALRLPDTVRKGALVDLYWRSGALSLRVPATALGAGRAGDGVSVRVRSTGARLAARIVGPGTVEAVR